MNLENKTIREIAVEIPASTRVFEELRIDYCCGGAKTLKEACQTVDLSPETVCQRISDAQLSKEFDPQGVFTNQVSPARLIDFIVDTHHVFTRNEIGRLEPLLAKVVRKHSGAHPFLNDLEPLFARLSSDLLPHMQKEEFVLFPFIKNLEVSLINGQPAPAAPFGSVGNPIRMMRMEHEVAGEILKEIRATTSDFRPPANACPSFRALYFGLGELETDLHRHIHLENNVLFPLAAEMEKKELEEAG